MPEIIAMSEGGLYELHDNGGLYCRQSNRYLFRNLAEESIAGIKSGRWANLDWTVLEPISLENE